MNPVPAIVALLLLGQPHATGEPDWQEDRVIDGIKVERREVNGSRWEELRLSTSSDLSLQALCDAVWANGLSDKKPEGDFKKRVVIRQTDAERLTYEQIKVPVVSDRDYVLRVKLRQPASTGRCEVTFETTTDPGFPPVSDHVRIQRIQGSWALEPQGDRVSIRYVIYSDPGGQVPALIARGGQRDAAVAFMKVILARARTRP